MKIQNEEAVSPGKAVTTEDAVSPVIGVILMVAITVILAAVVAAFVFGLAGTTQTTRTVGMTVALDKDNTSAFQVTFTGGADLSALSYMVVNVDGATATPDEATSPPGETGADNLVAVDEDRIEPNDANTDKFSVGQIVKVDVATELGGATEAVSGHRVTIIGTFTDGGDQILYDRTL